MENKIFLLALLGLLLIIPAASAQDISYYKQNTTVDFKVPCINNYTLCSGAALCNLTVRYSNDTILFNSVNMTNINGYFNYTFSNVNTSISDIYKADVFCNDSGTYGYSLFNLGITFNGKAPPESSTIIFFIAAFIAIVSLILYTLIHVLVQFKTLEIDPYDILYCFVAYFALFIIYGMNITYMGNAMIDSLLNVLIVAFGFTHIILPLILFFVAYMKQLADMKFQQQNGGGY
jgi:hypothetical protein